MTRPLTEGAQFDVVLGGERIDCGLPHDYEVFAIFNAEGDDFPGADGMKDIARSGCRAAFPDYVGTDYLSSRLGIYWLYADEGAWKQGDRQFICSLYLDGEQLQGSERGAGI